MVMMLLLLLLQSHLTKFRLPSFQAKGITQTQNNHKLPKVPRSTFSHKVNANYLSAVLDVHSYIMEFALNMLENLIRIFFLSKWTAFILDRYRFYS